MATRERRHHYHAYVVELSDQVWNVGRFRRCNPDYRLGKPFVYVGACARPGAATARSDVEPRGCGAVLGRRAAENPDARAFARWLRVEAESAGNNLVQ